MALLKQLLNGSLSALLNEQREFFVLRPGWAYRRAPPQRNLRNELRKFFSTRQRDDCIVRLHLCHAILPPHHAVGF